MRTLRGRAAEEYVAQLERRGSRLEEVEPAVRGIVSEVRTEGDPAVLRWARKFDGLRGGQSLGVSGFELKAAWDGLPRELRSAFAAAARNIRQFSLWQRPKSWSRSRNGISLGQMVRPLDSVGCYVPGGRFPLVSTLLMTVIPAQVAGVRDIRVASPRPSPEVLAAAWMLGVREFYRIGGAHAIASLAYGTGTIPRVAKIVGPGNLYVTAAKKLVSFDCAIDMVAGPTEAVIVSSKGNPAFIAADLVAQSEHDPETVAVFITPSAELGRAVRDHLEHRLADPLEASGRRRPLLPVEDNARRSLSTRGAALVARSLKQAFDWANRIAPEHITVEKKDLALVRNAGSVFLGDYSAQAAGDYASGPNHVLPTAGAARFRGGLSVMDFVKLISVQELSRKGLERMAPAIVRLAEAEGLPGHADSIRVRCAHA
ncbi:MAG: histidinol dehydrogenase [Acidobacteria bacterium]|nr:histidinol dehydrogenase [Acidobacteriota bacterium]